MPPRTAPARWLKPWDERLNRGDRERQRRIELVEIPAANSFVVLVAVGSFIVAVYCVNCVVVTFGCVRNGFVRVPDAS